MLVMPLFCFKLWMILVAEQFALICFLCLCCWLVGRVGPQIGPSGARTPLPLIPCQLQNPFLISFFPPTHIITPPHLDQKVTFLPFLEPTGYSVTIKVYHDAITVTLSRLIDNWSTSSSFSPWQWEVWSATQLISEASESAFTDARIRKWHPQNQGRGCQKQTRGTNRRQSLEDEARIKIDLTNVNLDFLRNPESEAVSI